MCGSPKAVEKQRLCIVGVFHEHPATTRCGIPGCVQAAFPGAAIGALTLAATAQPAQATSCTWDGTTGNWSDSARWSCGAAPTWLQRAGPGGAVDDRVVERRDARDHRAGRQRSGRRGDRKGGVTVQGDLAEPSAALFLPLIQR